MKLAGGANLARRQGTEHPGLDAECNPPWKRWQHSGNAADFFTKARHACLMFAENFVFYYLSHLGFEMNNEGL
jgi:hypothetical protein